MKNLLLSAAFLFSFSSIAGIGISQLEPTPIHSSYHTSYIPFGFDTNDQTQIVAEGSFSNSCYSPAGYNVNVDHKTKEIKVQPKAYRYDGMCLMVIKNYSEVVDLGLLKVGNYDVIQESGNRSSFFGQISVRTATNSEADDFLYAPVDSANYSNGEVEISGDFTNSCMELADVMVKSKDNVIVVQPISELVDNGKCKEGKFPYSVKKAFKPHADGRFLLHVRSYNSKSINKLVDIN